MGSISSGDIYNQKCDKTMGGLDDIIIIVDHVVIASHRYTQHFSDIEALLKRFKDLHITLNIKKIMLVEDHVKFAG